jgi:hypothetical protein
MHALITDAGALRSCGFFARVLNCDRLAQHAAGSRSSKVLVSRRDFRFSTLCDTLAVAERLTVGTIHKCRVQAQHVCGLEVDVLASILQ